MSHDKVYAFYESRIQELETELAKVKQALKGRGPQKLDEDKVKEIIRLRREGMKIKDVAAQFGIMPSAVTNIMHGRSWAHVPR